MRLLLWLVALPLLGQPDGETRLHRGDDLRWADPAFDDRGWETVARHQVRPIADAAENRLWLRTRVTVPADEPAAVLVYRCACEVFLNGVRLGATGDLDVPRPDATGHLRVFPIPPELGGRTAVLSVRQYYPPGIEAAHGFAFWLRVRVLTIRDVAAAAWAIRQTVEMPYLVRFMFLVLALGGLLSAATGQRRDGLLLSMLGYVFAQSAMTVLVLFPLPSYADNWGWIWLFGMGVIPALVLVQWQLAALPLRRGWVAAAVVGYLVFRLPWTAGLFLAKPASWTPLSVAVFLVPSVVTLGLDVYAAVKSWNRSPWLVRVLLVAGTATVMLNFSTRLSAQGWLPAVTLPLGLFTLNGDTLATLAFTCLATAYIIRTGRERRAEEQRLRSEMESAQTVQALLLGQSLPADVDAVYLPASEVGGDFYQVFATGAGTLVIVGDVSGKGLQAAMRVSAIVGALRSHRSEGPAEVLAHLNAVLLGAGGFVTCCCVLVEADTLRIANAGHPAPYLDGVEFAGESGLPLGLVADAAYAELRVPRPAILTLISDGVVEAANAHGELFGFDRTCAIARKPAREIAEAARQWGQTDDITVVTVRRSA